MKDNNVRSIQSVDRAIQILKCFDNQEELGVTEISKLLGLHKSTTFGLVYTLHANGILEQNESNGKYKLGLEIFRIANNVNTSLRHIVIPYLKELVKIYKETANLVIFQDLSVLYLEKVESSYSMRISTTVGGEKPLHCTAVGKSILAFLPEDDLIDKIKRMDFHRFTERTITTPNKLIESLKDIRKIGYAEEDEELEIGLHCIAAPIFNKYNIPFAAISLSGPVSRMNSEILADMGKTLVELTNEISKKMGLN